MENHIKYSKAVSWFNDCRIPFVDEGDIKSATPGSLNATGEFSSFGFKSGNELNTQGRFPANLLVSDDMLNDGVISKSVSGGISSGVNFGGETTKYRNRIGHDDKGTNSRYYDIDKWFNKIIE
jgi:hypothetical protein